jgi:hypothetical protein
VPDGLVQAERRGDIVIVLEPRSRDLVIPVAPAMTIEDIAADAMQAHVPRTAGEFGRASDGHATSPVAAGLVA